jgi:hypothetical protein
MVNIAYDSLFLLFVAIFYCADFGSAGLKWSSQTGFISLLELQNGAKAARVKPALFLGEFHRAVEN